MMQNSDYIFITVFIYKHSIHVQDISYLIPLFHTGPEFHKLPRIDKYLDWRLILTQFVKILTESHSP